MLILLQSPVDARIREGFGLRSARRVSRGVTFDVPYGASVRAAQSGRVIEAKRGGVAIEHAPGLVTYYRNDAGVVTVRRNQVVQRGDIIARSVSPGLLFAVWLGDRFVDPSDALLLGVNSTARGVTPGGHKPGGEVNWHTLRGELLTYVVLGLLLWATTK